MRATTMFRLTVVAMMVLLLTLPFSGCGGESGSVTSGTGSAIVTTSLSPEGVVMVNGKELTKADLADEMSLLKLALMEGDSQLYGDYASLLSELPKPDTPEYAALEKQLVDLIIREEIIAQEWEKMGTTAINTEVYFLMEETIKSYGGEDALNRSLARINKTLDWYNQQLEDIVLENKVREITDKNAPAGVDEDETFLNKHEAFIKWYGEKRNQSDIQYADKYRPSTPFGLSSFLAQQAFLVRFPVWITYKIQIEEISNQIITSQIWLASPDYSGLPPATEPMFQKMEKMQTDMAAKTQNMTAERKKIADELLSAMREYTDLYRQDIATSAGGVTYSPYFDQLTQLYKKILTLGEEWLWLEQ